MVLQNFSPIRCFLHNKWAQNMAAEEKKTKKKKKKKKPAHPEGIPSGRDAPITWFFTMFKIDLYFTGTCHKHLVKIKYMYLFIWASPAKEVMQTALNDTPFFKKGTIMITMVMYVFLLTYSVTFYPKKFRQTFIATKNNC